MRIKVASFRAELAEMLRLAREQAITVVRHGEPVAVIVSPEDFAELERLRSMYRTIPKRHAQALAFRQ